MKKGDSVKSKDTNEMGVIFSNNGTYSSWGEYHLKVKWKNGITCFCPVKNLIIVRECNQLKTDYYIKQKL
jgi:hypothetical protein